LLILSLVTSLAFSQAYKWRDASGRIQYSDTPPPPGAKDVQQLRKPAAGPAPATAPKTLSEQDTEFRKRLAEKQEADTKQAKAAEDDQTRRRNYDQARGQLQAIESGGRLVQFNAAGERIAMEDAQRELLRIESQKAVAEWCK
jgi:hypothetical protein